MVDEHGELLSASREFDFARIEEALHQADADVARLEAALVSLNPEAIAAELKTVLRQRSSPMQDDTELIRSLRQRHETVHVLKNRRDDIAGQIERTLVDVDAYAAKAVELSFVAGASSSSVLNGHVDRLLGDIDALHRAHEQLGVREDGV